MFARSVSLILAVLALVSLSFPVSALAAPCPMMMAGKNMQAEMTAAANAHDMGDMDSERSGCCKGDCPSSSLCAQPALLALPAADLAATKALLPVTLYSPRALPGLHDVTAIPDPHPPKPIF